jgi:hypothetical protein
MACCAFALYLLTQLLLPVRWLRDRLFGAPRQTASASVAWAPGMTVATPARRSRMKPVLLAIIAAEVLGVAAYAAPATPVAEAALFTQFHQSLCTSVFGRVP